MPRPASCPNIQAMPMLPITIDNQVRSGSLYPETNERISP
jgi:hypothetical protein